MHPWRAALAPSSPDAPARLEVPAPRGLFERPSGPGGAPPGRCVERFRTAELVAEPGIAHEGPAAEADSPFARIVDEPAAAGDVVRRGSARALRLPSGGGAFEPDAGCCLDAAAERVVRSVG